jgi:hypothetical protein
MMEEPTAFVGVDWASAEHQVCALGPAGPIQRAFLHDAAGLGAMVDWLSTLADRPDLVAVAIETPHGPVVEALMDRGLAVYAINPKQLDRFRDRFSPAGAKDDRRDALVLASSLRTDRHCFRRLEGLDPSLSSDELFEHVGENQRPPPDREGGQLASSNERSHGGPGNAYFLSGLVDGV